MSSKKNSPKKSTAAQPRRWSIGIFTSKESGEPVVMYCSIDGVIAKYLSKKVTSKKASMHGVYKNMTYAQARAKLLGPKLLKAAAKKTPSKEERKAA